MPPAASSSLSRCRDDHVQRSGRIVGVLRVTGNQVTGLGITCYGFDIGRDWAVPTLPCTGSSSSSTEPLMSLLRPLVFLALSLIVAAPAAAQDRSGRSRGDQVGNRHGGDDSDADSDSDSDSEDSDRRGRKHGDRSDRRNGGRDACIDIDRDGRCDYSPSDSRFPDRRSRDRASDDICVDRNRDGRCDARRDRSRSNRRGIPSVLEAIVLGR